jgi:TRAP-type C4-dicarboxylate transport system permease small subunit
MGSLGKRIKAAANRVEQSQRWAALVSGLFITILMFITVYEVVMRYFLRLPTGRTQEVEQYYLLVGAVFFGIGFTLLEEGHVAVDLLVSKLPPRVQLVMEGIIASIVIIAFAVLLIWGGVVLAVRHQTATTPVTAMPLVIGYILIPIGSFLLLFQAVIRLIKKISLVRSTKT